MSETNDIFDVTILGAGPVGMYGAYYAGFRRLKMKLIDSLTEVGGQITALYPEKDIYDVAGFPRIRGKDLVRALADQMNQYEPTLALGEKAMGLTRREDGLLEIRTDKQVHLTRVLLIAGGIGLFTPRRYADESINKYEWKGLYYVMTDPHIYQDKRVLVSGGGDSAVDWALHLHRIARDVAIIHRRDEFRAHEDSVHKMRQAVKVLTPYVLKTLEGDNKVERAIITNTKTKQDEVFECDMVLGCLGFIANAGPIREWGLELINDGVKVNIRMETSIPGVYAAGDISQYEGKPKIISVGFGEAAVAINNASVYIDPQKRIFPGHSSGH
ncbi:MAG: NAD(P)/FAD-dependent oxidoreductase [Deltaproteobacteria bacterium]|nr:NAD(P)/FAD-dependent oxidoreductase [Deltaproteobacteria bacterium]